MFFINGIYWLWAFIVPVLILGIPGWLLYEKSETNLVFFILLALLGIVVGVYVAERIRKGPGLSKFFGSISASADVKDRNEPKA